MHNKYWFSVLAMQFCCVLHQVTTLTVGVYYAKYILNDAKLVGNIIMYHHFPALVVMLLVPIALDKGASKRTLAILSGVSMLLGSLISLVYASGVPFIISMGLRGIGFGAFSSVIYGMLADTVEYGEWKTGVRTQAINVTANGVGQKIGSGLGTAAFGGLLDNVRLQRHGRSADRKRCKLHPYYLHRCADRDLSNPHCSGMAVQAGQAVPANSEGVGGA